MRSYWVYILASRSRRLYVGVTNDLERRLAQHQPKSIECFTKRYNIDRLVYFKETPGVRSAISRKKQIKGWSRSKKVALIEVESIFWNDLSVEWGKADSSLRSE